MSFYIAQKGTDISKDFALCIKCSLFKKKNLNVQIIGGSKLRSARGKFFPGKNKVFEYLDYMYEEQDQKSRRM